MCEPNPDGHTVRIENGSTRTINNLDIDSILEVETETP